MKSITKYIKNILQNHKPAWLNHRMIWIILVLLVLFTTLAWSKPGPNNQHTQNQLLQTQGKTPTATDDASPTPSPSPIPDEWIQNSENTNDIVLVGVLLVMIVVGGTYNAIRQSKKSQKKPEE